MISIQALFLVVLLVASMLAVHGYDHFHHHGGGFGFHDHGHHDHGHHDYHHGFDHGHGWGR